MENTIDTREGMPDILNAEKYEKLRERYGTRGPVDREAFLREFARDEYSEVTWLYVAGGECSAEEMVTAKAEDRRYRAYLLKKPKRLSTCSSMINPKPRVSKNTRLRNRQKQD